VMLKHRYTGSKPGTRDSVEVEDGIPVLIILIKAFYGSLQDPCESSRIVVPMQESIFCINNHVSSFLGT
jgi:hypothetical protein